MSKDYTYAVPYEEHVNHANTTDKKDKQINNIPEKQYFS